MFEAIHISNVLPNFLTKEEALYSDIWQREVFFRKDEYNLVTAVSGAGKSSLLSYIFGERNDYAGDILFDNNKIDLLRPAQWSEIRQNRIGFVFQGLRLFSSLTALENINLKNRLTGYKSDDEIVYMFERAGLADKLNEKAAFLSFGQQQRVAIIRALCQPFDFLLLDEPFSHLDDTNIANMAQLIVSELKAKQAGMLLCSLGIEYPFDYHHKWKL